MSVWLCSGPTPEAASLLSRIIYYTVSSYGFVCLWLSF